jgi:cell division protein ZapB
MGGRYMTIGRLHLFPVSPGARERNTPGTSNERPNVTAKHAREAACRCVARAFKQLPGAFHRAYESTLRKIAYALTRQDFPNYSASMDAAMETDLACLEEKIRQTAELCQRLREENRALRQRLALLEGDRHELEQKIDGARTRLEHLLQRIPE